ncbi:N-acetylmuramoyl-L-alanine amidase [Bacillus sp. AGMB 02131]|uniref:N-acetylmuramoyl-L-alanine amidase n=1 Tax=Peribacillus faecalis TaxID=2772559 RepID=A0A927CVI1_9BACI|nr:N-acetylmuramoyl-L-alanine amidase [Peribacillus faecalis]MBD3108572.1 N-acetylmuramoyl-L-alanine amidase [Peribacillus faecalis]
MKIVLDAGHGYETAGKRSPNGVREYEINRAIAIYTRDLLTAYQNVSVYFTHSDKRDVPLKARTDQANSLKADCFVSIHANAYGDGKSWNSAHGIETYVHPDADSETITLAELVQRQLFISTGLRNRGVKQANFHVLRETKMTAILVECGFMTNEGEMRLLKTETFRRACAEAIAKGIAEKYRLKKKTNEPAVSQSPTGGLYKVQTGAFKEKKKAEQLALTLEEKGYKTYIVFEQG